MQPHSVAKLTRIKYAPRGVANNILAFRIHPEEKQQVEVLARQGRMSISCMGRLLMLEGMKYAAPTQCEA